QNAVQRLSTKARMVLALELRGLRKSEIATRLRLKENAVHYIAQTKRYIDTRAVLLDYLDHEFLAMKPAAFNALRRGLASCDENVAVRASEQWMRTSGFMQHGKGEKTQGDVTAEDVVRQLLGAAGSVNVDDTRVTSAGRARILSARGTTVLGE